MINIFLIRKLLLLCTVILHGAHFSGYYDWERCFDTEGSCDVIEHEPSTDHHQYEFPQPTAGYTGYNGGHFFDQSMPPQAAQPDDPWDSFFVHQDVYTAGFCDVTEHVQSTDHHQYEFPQPTAGYTGYNGEHFYDQSMTPNSSDCDKLTLKDLLIALAMRCLKYKRHRIVDTGTITMHLDANKRAARNLRRATKYRMIGISDIQASKKCSLGEIRSEIASIVLQRTQQRRVNVAEYEIDLELQRLQNTIDVTDVPSQSLDDAIMHCATRCANLGKEREVVEDAATRVLEDESEEGKLWRVMATRIIWIDRIDAFGEVSLEDIRAAIGRVVSQRAQKIQDAKNAEEDGIDSALQVMNNVIQELKIDVVQRIEQKYYFKLMVESELEDLIIDFVDQYEGARITRVAAEDIIVTLEDRATFLRCTHTRVRGIVSILTQSEASLDDMKSAINTMVLRRKSGTQLYVTGRIKTSIDSEYSELQELQNVIDAIMSIDKQGDDHSVKVSSAEDLIISYVKSIDDELADLKGLAPLHGVVLTQDSSFAQSLQELIMDRATRYAKSGKRSAVKDQTSEQSLQELSMDRSTRYAKLGKRSAVKDQTSEQSQSRRSLYNRRNGVASILMRKDASLDDIAYSITAILQHRNKQVLSDDAKVAARESAINSELQAMKDAIEAIRGVALKRKVSIAVQLIAECMSMANRQRTSHDFNCKKARIQKLKKSTQTRGKCD